jgi:hypothetical protein
MTTRRGGVRRGVGVVALGLVLAAAARAEGQTLSVIGAAGLRGGTVAAVIQLAGDPGTAVTADLDITFPTDLVAFHPPVRSNCAIAPRLSATHQVGGMLPEDGRVRLAIFARNLSIAPLGDGELATCSFQILPDAPDSPAPLGVAFAALGGANGQPLPVAPVDGEIVISDAPNQPTPTVVPRRCVADCNGDGVVAVNEVIRGVNIGLDNAPLAQCPAADRNGDGAVTIGELIEAVNDVIGGC